MPSSQSLIPIKSTEKGLIFLNDGGVALLLSVSAVNFALLFETEQVSIIDSFAGLLNSLSFPIQIIIYSRVMDVSQYLLTIDKAMAHQTNALLRNMTVRYRDFVEKSIKDNNVLDKQFYVCVKITGIELGLLHSSHEDVLKKATTLLEPKKDHLIRQFGRLGLKSHQLNSEEIVKLFYGIYNAVDDRAKVAESLPPIPTPTLNTLSATIVTPSPVTPLPVVEIPQPQPPLPPKIRPLRVGLNPQIVQPSPINQPTRSPLTPPFVVEELQDDTGP